MDSASVVYEHVKGRFDSSMGTLQRVLDKLASLVVVQSILLGGATFGARLYVEGVEVVGSFLWGAAGGITGAVGVVFLCLALGETLGGVADLEYYQPGLAWAEKLKEGKLDAEKVESMKVYRELTLNYIAALEKIELHRRERLEPLLERIKRNTIVGLILVGTFVGCSVLMLVGGRLVAE